MLVPIPQFDDSSPPSPASRVVWTCYRAESTNLMRLETSGQPVA
jgi:hypothetical protein